MRVTVLMRDGRKLAAFPRPVVLDLPNHIAPAVVSAIYEPDEGLLLRDATLGCLGVLRNGEAVDQARQAL